LLKGVAPSLSPPQAKEPNEPIEGITPYIGANDPLSNCFSGP
jgi:hypothetical protein